MAKRIVLFLVVNVLVMLTISVLTALLGLDRSVLHGAGIDYQQLMVFCLIWGMAGSLISLALSRIMAKRMMGVQVVDPETTDPQARALIMTVRQLAEKAGIAMPEVGVYESPELNAFATGPTKRRSLVAVSSGLLQRMDRSEVEGVLGHEITHIANGDMVTMTLLQGIINAFVMFLARVIAWGIANASRRDNDERPSYYMVYPIQMVLEMVFMLMGSMVIAAFSRWREFRADAGGARVAGRQQMIRALQALQRNVEGVEQAPAAIAAFRISNPGGFTRFFMSHPPLDERIMRLQQLQV